MKLLILFLFVSQVLSFKIFSQNFSILYNDSKLNDGDSLSFTGASSYDLILTILNNTEDSIEVKIKKTDYSDSGSWSSMLGFGSYLWSEGETDCLVIDANSNDDSFLGLAKLADDHKVFTIYDIIDCSVDDTVTITVIYDFSASDVLNNSSDYNILLYPNPIEDIAVIEIDKNYSKILYLEIYNITGKKAFTREIDCLERNKIDLSHLTRGSYFFRVISQAQILTKGVFFKN